MLPAIAPDLHYDALEGVQDGGMAMDAFLEAVAPTTDKTTKDQIERQLLDYCHLDTYAMVRLLALFLGSHRYGDLNAMAKRPDTKETVLLAVELLRRIPRNRKVSASELLEQVAPLNLDIRTIQRQMAMLSEHFDIERDETNKPYGYKWKENAKGLALPMLSEQDSLLLTLAEQQFA